MSGTKRALCLLDVKDLMLLKSDLGYDSLCPACQRPLAEHSDINFQAEKLAGIESGDDSAARSSKKQKVISVAKAARLVRRGKLCEFMGCTSTPSYSHPGQKKPRFCSLHKEEGMINPKSILCEIDGCGKYANYNSEGEKNGRFCFSHKSPEMINVKAQLCKAENCNKIPSYNFPSEPKALYCKLHVSIGMVDVKHTTCEFDGCFTRPHFNFPGMKKGRFCATHKEEGMVGQDWVGKSGVKPDYKKYMNKCEAEGCSIQANFNTPGLKRARFCVTHKEPAMKNVHERFRCEEPSCQKHPYFNHRGEKKGRFCNSHKEVGMLNVYSTKCEVRGCDRGAHYHAEGETRVRRCADHKEEGMCSGAKKRPQCEAPGCEKRPTFFFPNSDTSARLCLLHKQDGMISRNSLKSPAI